MVLGSLDKNIIAEYYSSYAKLHSTSKGFISNLLSDMDECILKERAENEYEIKFKILEEGLRIQEYLYRFEDSFTRSSRYLVDRVQECTNMTSYFFTDKEKEYSIFKYKNETMLKIKKHRIIEGDQFPIFVNEELFHTKSSEIISQIMQPAIIYKGRMVKHRIKDFIVDTIDGRVYSLAVTICEASGKLQYQLEVEYSGYIKGYGPFIENHENQIIESLEGLASFVYSNLKKVITPDTQRKFEFVIASTDYDSIEEIIDFSKQKILKEEFGVV
ncbi:hypothetical protein PAECIP111802_07458 [Paenibacillus allorhizosphaerae]|uniref:Uncharacterized protein n=1 Tax=Paenibacillus allorhizosphaerae TaxID=2849866 RepID=A0ABN7TXF9_9BACL|nr:hypothetical protein [Paenibacillus allorhizosphaerae]CAG7659188.1 hypothetical protein PAECIP111802_07458 [Paenibacillus allorhizosphaerae]